MLSTEELLRKALVVSDGSAGAPFGTTGADFGGVGQAPLSIEQVSQFIELMSASQVMLADVKTVTSGSAKWQESILDMGARIARPGVEATRLSSGDRTKPVTGIVEISTVLLRAEIPVSDEVLEDNVAGANIVNSIQRLIADRMGYDIEDLFVNGDVSGGADSYMRLSDGWLITAKNLGHAVDGTTYGQDYQEIFRVLLNSLPDRFKRQLETDFRFYLPQRTTEKYRDILASRGTPLGDLMLTGKNELRYQGIQIVGVPSFAIAAGSPDKSSVLLANHNNLYAGYHRHMKFETYRDPREGVTSFVVTARVDAEIAVPSATCIAYNVDVSV
jgi:HK97 family phage major capsid protein